MNHFLNSSRLQAGIGNNLSSQTRLGIVTSYNPADCTVKVSLQPEDQENPEASQTGWIPLSTSFIGLVGAPRINDQVVGVFQEGSLNCGIIIGKIYNDEDIPPSVPSGEWWLTHPSGSSIKIKENGEVEIIAASKIIAKAPDIELSNGGTIKKIVNEAMVAFFNTHTPGGGATPDQAMGNGQLSTIVKVE